MSLRNQNIIKRLNYTIISIFIVVFSIFVILANILSRATLLYGKQALLNDYNNRVAKTLNSKSSQGKLSKTIGVMRGMQQIMVDVETYGLSSPRFVAVGALFNAKKEFYRLISLVLSGLGVIFDIRSPSPWQIILELQTREIITMSDSAKIKISLAIANEIRLKTYFANKGQKELFSSVPQYSNEATELSADVPIFCDFDEDVLVRLLSTSDDMSCNCREFCRKFIKEDNIDVGVFQSSNLVSSKPYLLARLYLRLQKFHKALEWTESESKDSPSYGSSLDVRGHVYLHFGEYDKGLECFEEALEWHLQNKGISDPGILWCIHSVSCALMYMRKYKIAIIRLEEAICKHSEIHGKGSETVVLASLMGDLGNAYLDMGELELADQTCKKVEEMYKRFTNIHDEDMILFYIYMAVSLSKLSQQEQALEYIELALQLGHKIYGRNNTSTNLARIYSCAGVVYFGCQNDKALFFFERSLEFYHCIIGDHFHHGKIISGSIFSCTSTTVDKIKV